MACGCVHIGLSIERGSQSLRLASCGAHGTCRRKLSTHFNFPANLRMTARLKEMPSTRYVPLGAK